MPKMLLLALTLFACTLVVPVFVWGNTLNWRRALTAWRWFAGWMALLYAVGLVTWLFML